MKAHFTGKTVRSVLIGIIILLGLSFRLSVVKNYSSSSPDGQQYFALSRELRREHRFAYAPAPASPIFSRLPGYPLFLAYVVDRGPVNQDTHVRRAAIANVLLDFGTSLIVLMMLRDRRMLRAGVGAMVGVFLCPLLFLMSAYALTESLTTFLLTLALWLGLRARESLSIRYALGAGAAAGLAQLVRADSITTAFAVVLALLSAGGSAGRRGILLTAFSFAAVAVFFPWPLRNMVEFGAPHFEGTEWPAQDGRPLPTGPMRWMRTWATGGPGEGNLSGCMVFRTHYDSRMILRQMYDTPEERDRLKALLDRAGKAGLDSSVDEEFSRLASERSARYPLKTYVVLPLRRIAQLWSPPPAGDLPIRVAFLGLPRTRWMFAASNWIIYLLSVAGVLHLLLLKDRAFMGILLAGVAARSLLHSFAVPNFVNQRYLAEVFPVLIVLASIGFGGILTQGKQASARFRKAGHEEA